VRRDSPFTKAAFLILGIAVLFCVSSASVLAQQSDATKFNQTYETLFAKATAECKTLWADHAFDRFRDKIPLGEEKPTFSMLKNSDRLNPKDRPIADLAMKTLERCRAAYAPVFAMLPPQVNNLMQGIQRKQDALIAELYSGKITFGQYNIGADRMLGEFASVVSGIKQTPQTASSPAAQEKKSTAVSETVTLSRSRPTEPNPIPKANVSHEIRLALVIGDSNYSNLPKLVNPANDARAIADLLRKMGFTTKLVLDASELDLRREVRKFANDTAKADVAFVFYAGHGAQVSGDNYVLPVDMGIPQTETDIQLTGLKVDDLVNSIRAKTKVVFLDACRDNPVLFKNLVKGRGSYPKGLAPAVGSSFQQANPGGGVFIAYATDAGSVALDGTAAHSPFTQALLRNLTKPISIDDMFSFVTKEVRLVTKNAQRPYKYASLENIVCLTGGCSTAPSAADTDIVQEAKRSETDDFQIALQTKNPEALETYLDKYPESQRRKEVLTAIAELRRSEFNEWTLFDVGNKRVPYYLKLGSIKQIGDRIAARIKTGIMPEIQAEQKYPDAAYSDEISVYDCKHPQFATAETTTVSKSGKTLYHYKWADPEYLNLSIGLAINPDTVAYDARNFLCHDLLHVPLVTKREVAAMNFSSLSSTTTGNGDIYYGPIRNGVNTANEKEVLLVFKMNEDTKVNFPPEVLILDVPIYRVEIDRTHLKCDESKTRVDKSEFYDASNNLVGTSKNSRLSQFVRV
jgi:uncharacterized caspase-like protein